MAKRRFNEINQVKVKMPERIGEIYFLEEYDILLTNGMFNPGRSGTEKEYLDFERDEIELHNKNFAECIEVF